MSTTENIEYILAYLACEHTVMQRKEDNPRLFWLLQQVPNGGREVTLYCPEDRRQPVTRLITRTRLRPHWPLMDKSRCHCGKDIPVPPAPAPEDEETMPHDIMRDGVYVRCPFCTRWGNYGHIGTGVGYYDIETRRTACPHCHQSTIVTYNPYEHQSGDILAFTCIECKQPFEKVFTGQPK